MQLHSHTSTIRAVLGPTNTGKTYFAIDRMLGHVSGMIGFPLRLLARENYERIVALRGASAVALITGEEKIVPASPSWFVCTVESMPLDRQVDFLAIDEIQLCGDPERGHVFTDRLLHARGRAETIFLGSDIIRSLIRSVVPEALFESRPRFSTLKYAGQTKVSRLPRRSAAIVFSGNDLYALAEQFRRQRGGAAVVLGALSPRARNAQVEMYQAGEVDHLVATDAIGMGLNIDIDHVAFASVTKFDGRHQRRLRSAEIGQIAGRAGRHMADGTFGVTDGLTGLDPTIIDAVEDHRFKPLRAIYWRNHLLDFTSSPLALLKSLETPPPTQQFILRRDADDHKALASLVKDETVTDMAVTPAAVRLLWEVCQIPDFRKVMAEHHTHLLQGIFLRLCRGGGLLPEDWVAAQIARLDDLGGEIDALTTRIAHVRTWTYVSNRVEWLADGQHWQERTRAIEDRLSDALHERLTQRFVDRHAVLLGNRQNDGGELLAGVNSAGDVIVEGEIVGQLAGLFFTVDPAVKDGTKVLRSAASKAAGQEVDLRVARLVKDCDGAFRLDEQGYIRWYEIKVAKLGKGFHILAPSAEPLENYLLDGLQRERIRARVQAWLDKFIRRSLSKLYHLQSGLLGGAARGLIFQVVEQLGSTSRVGARAQVDALEKKDRRILSRMGLRVGKYSVFVTSLLQPEVIRFRALLWAVFFKQTGLKIQIDGSPFIRVKRANMRCLSYVGYRRFGGVGLRVDTVERLVVLARQKARQGSFLATADLVKAAGCEGDDLVTVMSGLGYKAVTEDMGVVFSIVRNNKTRRSKGRVRTNTKLLELNTNSPFAKLRELNSVK